MDKRLIIQTSTRKEMRTCEKHGQYECEITTIFGTEFETSCPECEKEHEAAEMLEVERISKQNREADYFKRGVEPEFYNKELKDYKAETPSEKEALNACMDLLKGNITKLMLLGANGTGKTMLASILVKELNGIRITMFELGCKIREGYNTGKNELDILDGLLSHKFICLDEVGRSKGSDAERNWLSYLIDKAHTRNIRLMIISNRQTAKNLPADRRGEAIEYFFDNDVISRLRQNSKIVEVKGRDRRAAKAAV